jgi:copper/silver efflux system protein
MIQRIIEYSIDNRFVVIAIVLAIAALGLYSVARAPIDAIPDLSENQVIVFADWMGRSPKEIEDQVTYPLSVNLQGLAGVKAVRATSEFNFSMIDIIFEDKVDFYFARERVLERLSIASTFLPAGVVPYLAPDATALGQIFWYTVEGKDQDLGELRAIQDWYVRYQLNSVPGVAQVASVGGFVKSYEISLDPARLRGYGLTLGQVVAAVSRSNSAVGGNVFVKNGAEYLIRGVGWIRGLDDLRRVVVSESGGTPVTLAQVASVQFAPEPRRALLEKNGGEAVGGVVLMRYGENPLEVTKSIKRKIEELQSGLPEGVRIVPFYDRTRLIESAIHTVTGVLREEMVIASIAILLILTHVGSALIVILTLPLAVLIAFILMRLFGIPSNIMSLSGIAISIGVLVDAAIVMVENATHELTGKFGHQPVKGDTRPIIREATRLVGRPIFFSILIMLLSFLPVFVLGGQEGKMFHPLAFTKSFAMIGVALLAITFVPAMLPIFLRGRLRSETENPIVRSFIEIYKPVLTFLMKHPKPFVWSFALLLSLGFVLSKHLGREFMPPLDEGSIMDMPVTIPSVSVAKAGDDIRVRDAVLRSFPEVESVVGKVGRADTPTDPAPPDMVETVINLRPKPAWPKRHVRFEDAFKESGRLLSLLQSRGVVRTGLDADTLDAMRNEATMGAVDELDRLLRAHASQAQTEFAPQLERSLIELAFDRVVARIDANGYLLQKSGPQRVPADARARITAGLGERFGASFQDGLGGADIAKLIAAARDSLVARGLAADRADLLRESRPALAGLTDPILALVGREPLRFQDRLLRDIDRRHMKLWRGRMRDVNYALGDFAPGALIEALGTRLHASAQTRRAATRDLTSEDVAALRDARLKPLQRSLFLWHKTKSDLVQEMDTALQMPGWGNIWTQPIINRVDMLATGVRTMVGVKVFGDDLYKIQEISEQIAEELRRVPGAVDVFPDQIVGENYLDIEIDREQAARYGVNVGDIQDVIEVALGGKTVTSTVEGRRRFPVRVRYARDFRTDEASIGEILIDAGYGSATGGGFGGASGGAGGGASGGAGGMGGSSNGGMSGGGGGMAGGGMSGGSGTSSGSGMSSGAGGASGGGMGGAGGAGASGGGSIASAFGAGASGTSAAGLPDLAQELSGASLGGPRQIPLSAVATIRVVQGPSMIKSENGLLRSYVQLNVRGRDVVGFVEDAQRIVQERVKLPAGYYIQWSGQFEHQVRAKKTLQIVFPAVIALIFMILYLTFRDLGHASLMVLAIPGALAGGVLFQTLFGFNFSVAVWVGYIAAFGMATETGIVMMVYLREAVRRHAGATGIRDEATLKQAVIEGAVHRLRPKLLTEGVAIVGLMPMLWAHGTGAEVMRPMVAPVLGGLLVADEVIDLLLPVLFYRLELSRWKRKQA